MILQTLTEYYREQVARGNPLYAPQGMELKRIHFIFVLTQDGTLTEIRQPQQKLSVVKSRQRAGKDSSRIANYMWDSLGYVTGYGADGKQCTSAAVQHKSFISEVAAICDRFPEKHCFRAVYNFYFRTDYQEKLMSHPLWEKIASQKGHNLSFCLSGEPLLAAQQPELTQMSNVVNNSNICMVTGQKAVIQQNHPKVFVPGGAATGSKLISFTRGCGYDSYYKNNGNNAPVSVEAAECYAAALTGLLQQESENSIVIDTISIL